MKVILFDFFGVLSTPVYMKVFNEYSPEDDLEGWIGLLDSLDDGSMTEQVLVQKIANAYNVSEDSIWASVTNAPEVNRELLEYINSELAGKYKIGIFSSIPRTLLERIVPEEIKSFDLLIISSDLGCVKPNDEIYDMAISICDVEPGEIIFVDDSEKNISVARRHGINGIVYSDIEKLKLELRSHRVGVF